MSKTEDAPTGNPPSERTAGRALAKSGGDPEPDQDNTGKAGKNIKPTEAKG